MRQHELLINAGDVIEVQLTSETVVIETNGRRRDAEPGHITNRMRLFVRETDGKEQTYDFEETELGVRNTQRVAIVRARLAGAPAPVNLILYNLSSGAKQPFDPAIGAYLHKKTLFGPIWKASGAALLIAFGFYLVSHFVMGRGAVSAGFLAAMFAFLAFPVVWWISGIVDRISAQGRFRKAYAAFVAAMDERTRAFAPASPQA